MFVLRKMSENIQGVLLDISGVLKNGSSVIPGSVAAFEKLRTCGIPVKMLTNETQETRSSVAKSLLSLGYEVHENDIIPPVPTLIDTLRSRKLRPYLLVHPNILPEFVDVDQSDPNCVVVGDAGDYFTYKNLNDAFKVLIQMDKPTLFTLGRGRYYKDVEGELVLDVGTYTAALEYALDIKAEVIGKPEESFFHSALSELGVKAENAVMIGDDLVSDVGGAQKCGLAGILVRTGKYRPSDEHHPLVKPDAIVNDLNEAVQCIVTGKFFR